MEGNKFKVFISSVQKEFEQEREILVDFFMTDVLLKSFFEPFIFERIAANANNPEFVFISEVKKADIYIGLLGTQYGFIDAKGISPTEKEYNAAKDKGIPRWIYILNTNVKRHSKEEHFIQKVSGDVSWKFFKTIDNLKKEVYHSCFDFLKQKGKIENNDFDNSLHPYASIGDLSSLLLKDFISIAREKRNFPEKLNALPVEVLKRLNLTRNNKVSNSALLIFSDNPQQYFPSATVTCAYFHGETIQKPIPDYKEFAGTVFQMANKAVDFVLSKISLSTGIRDKSNLVETQYEIPREAIAEAVINALAHRDYLSKGSIQISVFKNRIEIENPGHLPDGISLEDLKLPHASYPQNPLLANCLFLTGAIERYGTGIVEMINKTTAYGLAEPVFKSQKSFMVTLWRKQAPENVTPQEKLEQIRSVFGVISDEIRTKFGVNVYKTMALISREPEITAKNIATELGLTQRTIENYLAKLKSEGYIERIGSDKTGSWNILKKED